MRMWTRRRKISTELRAWSPIELKARLQEDLSAGRRIVFTNGVFDLVHPGHVRYLKSARKMGDLLVVALNSDESVRRLKGPKRPVLPQNERVKIIASFEMVDYVTVFEEDTPFEIIDLLKPDVLVKGGDYAVDEIVGRDVVEQSGGVVKTLPFVQGASSTTIIERIIASAGEKHGSS